MIEVLHGVPDLVSICGVTSYDDEGYYVVCVKIGDLKPGAWNSLIQQ